MSRRIKRREVAAPPPPLELVRKKKAPLLLTWTPPMFSNEERDRNRNAQAPNFRENGKFQLVRCYYCNRNNLSVSVPRGVCHWCGARGV